MTLEQAKELAIKYATDCLIGKAMITKSYDGTEYAIVTNEACFNYQFKHNPNDILYIIDGGWKFLRTKDKSGYVLDVIKVTTY